MKRGAPCGRALRPIPLYHNAIPWLCIEDAALNCRPPPCCPPPPSITVACFFCIGAAMVSQMVTPSSGGPGTVTGGGREVWRV